eukprot:7485336-Pyramimonas_sp.AAC.1
MARSRVAEAPEKLAGENQRVRSILVRPQRLVGRATISPRRSGEAQVYIAGSVVVAVAILVHSDDVWL